MKSTTKSKKGQAKEKEQHRRQKIEKQRSKSKGSVHGPRPTRNQKEVAKRLLAGEVSMVGGTGWSFVEPFLAFLGEIGFYEVIQIDGERFIRKMMAVSLLILTYEVKVLLGLAGMNCVGTTLFRDIVLLKLIGYSTRQLQEGFCQRGYGDKQKPMHKNVLADEIEKLTAKELETILNTSIQRLAIKGVFGESQGHFALDGSDLETTALYREVGTKTVTEKHWSRKEKKVVEIEKTVYGFKLLIDRGFLDGLTLWQIKNEDGIDFVIPVKANMQVTNDARAFLKQKPDGEYLFAAERPGEGGQQTGHVKLIGIKSLTSYDQYGDEEHQQQSNRSDFEGNPINAIVVTEFYALFDIETVFILLGSPPDFCWRVDSDQVYPQYASVGLVNLYGAI